MTLEFLLRSWRRTGDEAVLRMVTVTLDRMASGGICDQLGGGFARYSTDAHWLAPHFEKMLYDNALLAHAYLEAYRATGLERYAGVARATLDFLITELRTETGGFASALDADSEGEEGRFYVWDHAEFRTVLRATGLDPAAIDQVAAHWGVTLGGNWDGHSILHVTDALAPEPAILATARAALLATRARRVRPGRDEKQLAAWNGLALRGLATGSLVLGDAPYDEATTRLVGFVRAVLLRDGDRVWRTARDTAAHTPGFAEDYACLADGLLAAYASGGDAADLRLAEALMARAVTDFWDEDSGTFFDTGPEHDRTVVRPRSVLDGATPGANSVAADVLLRLALLTGDAEHDRRARRILRSVEPGLARQPSAFGRMLSAAARAVAEPVDAVIAGDHGDPRTVALRRAVGAPYAPDLVIAPLEPGTDLEGLALFAGKVARGGVPTAFICRGSVCDEPTVDPDRAAAQVVGLAGAT